MKLKDLIESSNTGLDAIKRAPIVDYNTGIKCLRIGDISNNRPFNEWGYTEVKDNNYVKFKLQKGDIIVARTGATIGINKFIDKDYKSVYNNGLIRIRVKQENNPKYVYYLLQSNNYKNFITTISMGTSTQPNMQMNDLLNLEIPRFDRYKQDKIVKILGDIDDKIELNNEINNNLHEEAVILFDNIFPEIQKGNKTIGEYLVPKRGKNLLSRDAKDGDIPVIAGGLAPATYHNQPNTHFPVITISASGANAGYTSLWEIPVWASDCSYIDDTITNNVYFWYIVLKTRQKEIFDAQIGSAQPHIYPQHIAEMPICELKGDKVREYNTLVEPLFKMIGHNTVENDRLSKLRDTLLPKLMNEEMDLDNIEI